MHAIRPGFSEIVPDLNLCPGKCPGGKKKMKGKCCNSLGFLVEHCSVYFIILGEAKQLDLMNNTFKFTD